MAELGQELFLYHYFDRDMGPFRTLTELPMRKARRILKAKKAAGKFGNVDINSFLQKRYLGDKNLRDAFVRHGGCPRRSAPYYMTLGAHRQWASAYERPAVIKIPLSEFGPLSVSFTYGDSFAVFNPALFGPEEYWNQIYFADEILRVVARHGFPPYVEYDFMGGVYPKDKHINHHLKYVEAHVWSDEVPDRYRDEAHWMEIEEDGII